MPVTGAPTSIRAYARHRGTSAPAVLRAIKSGRLKASLVYIEGVAQIADVALADREWAANTMSTNARPAPSSAPPVPTTIVVLPTPPEGTPGPTTLNEALTREKHFKALQAELEFKKDAGQLVDGAEARAWITNQFTLCKTKLLAVPSKVKQRLPHLSHADVVVIDSIVREALEELADAQAPPSEGTAA